MCQLKQIIVKFTNYQIQKIWQSKSSSTLKQETE